MKIFVGFGYNQRDAWVREIVFPIIESFDAEILSGENLQGLVLADAVKEKISECDALLGFFTPRDEKANGKFTTHDWVRDEFSFALNTGKEAVPVVEYKVDWNDGMAGNRQRVEFKEETKEKLLVELVKVLSKWKKTYGNKRLRFLPSEIMTEVKPLLSKGKVKCTYRYLIGSWESEEMEAPLLKIAGGLCADIKNLPPPNSLVQVKVLGDQFMWASDYESMEFLSINLTKE
ncbi:hypothetical protein BH10BAC2_BH10BAC2_15840 [soil metagenome]